MEFPVTKSAPRRDAGVSEVGASGAESSLGGQILRGKAAVRMVVGITSDQTCLVLTGRLRALQRAGFGITLISSPGELLVLTAREQGVAAWPVSMSRQISLLRDIGALLELCWVLFRIRPQVTDFSTPKAGLLGNLAAGILRIPHRVYTLRGLKLESATGIKRRLLLWAERLAAGCAHVVLCNSDSLLEMAAELAIAPREKLRVLGHGSSNGVDTVRFCPGSSFLRERMGIASADPVVGFVGRLTGDKGIPELLEAFDLILESQPRCWLLLAGWFDAAEDALGEHWREWIRDHPRILHVGYVADTVEHYRAIDVLILPTHREGFPNVVLEAAACGVPVITTESTGARDAVISEVTGLLVPPGYPEAIAEAAVDLLGSASRRKRMGEAARLWVVERYSNERVLELAVEFYRGLVEGTDAR